MMRVFGVKKDKQPSIQDTSDRINKRGETVDEKIKKLDTELARCREQIKKTRPGPAQEVIKARAMRILKQKRVYEGQRDMLYNQTCNLDQVAFASEETKDAKKNKQACRPKFMVSPFTFNLATGKQPDLDALEADMDTKDELMVSPLIFNRASNLIWNLNLTCQPSCTYGQASANTQVEDDLGLLTVPPSINP